MKNVDWKVIKKWWSRFASTVAVAASLATIYALVYPADVAAALSKLIGSMERAENSVSRVAYDTGLIAESIPEWLDIEVIGTVTGPNAFHPDIEVQEDLIFRMTNPSNFPIRVEKILASNDRGKGVLGQSAFVVPACGFEGVEVSVPLHRLTDVCITGRLHDGTYILETRSLELTAPMEGDPMAMMGLAQFSVRILDQQFDASEDQLKC